jgi:D-glycero-D-manno-heptose 1,7-bisphosphate phosphatase
MTRAVFLDRDGVINRLVWRDGRPGSPRSFEEFHLDSSVIQPLEHLHKAGLKLFVITNQPDLARGLLSQASLQRMNHLIFARLPIEAIAICPHDDQDNCDCRKPRPGMLERIAADRQIQLAGSFVIGDTWRDTGAARAAGCSSIILDRHYNRSDEADYRVRDVIEAVQLVIERTRL